MASSPVPDAAARQYREASGRAYHEGKRGLPAGALPWVQALRAEKFQRHVGPRDTVVEFGVGAGWNLARLACARRIGVDAADFLADELRSQGIEFVGDVAAISPASADVLLCHHALEHVLEPAAVLREFARVLKPDGLLIVHVPWEVEGRYARYDPAEPNHHLFHWNAQNLGNLAAVLGWRIESIGARRYGYDRFAATLALRLRLGATGFRALRAALIALRPCQEIELVARPPSGSKA